MIAKDSYCKYSDFFLPSHLCHWLNKHLSHPSIFLFRLDFRSSFSFPRRRRRKRAAESFPERQLVIEPTFCVDWRPLPVIHLLKIKLVGLKCSDRKHRTIYLQFLFHPLQAKISSLDCKSCILSCPLSLDKWLPCWYTSYLLWSRFVKFISKF